MQKPMSLKYEPASEPLHIGASGGVGGEGGDGAGLTSSSLLLSSLELSDKKVYEPQIRALLGCGADFQLVRFSAYSSRNFRLETTQGQFDGLFSQLPYKFHQNRVASVGD